MEDMLPLLQEKKSITGKLISIEGSLTFEHFTIYLFFLEKDWKTMNIVPIFTCWNKIQYFILSNSCRYASW